MNMAPSFPSPGFEWINVVIKGVASHGITPHFIGGVTPVVFRSFFTMHFGLLVWNKKIYVISNLLTSSKQKVNYIIGQHTQVPFCKFYQNYSRRNTLQELDQISYIHED